MGSKTTPEPSRYAHINDRQLLERNADAVMALKEEGKEHRKVLVALRDEVRLALRPTYRAWYERVSMPAMVLIALVFLIVYTTKVSSATTPEPVVHGVAGR
jgi:hypothetical protein